MHGGEPSWYGGNLDMKAVDIRPQADWSELPDKGQYALQASSEQLRHSFQKIILKAQSVGELRDTIPANRAAIWLQGQFIALRTLAAGMENPTDVEWMVDKIIGDLPNDWANKA